jgi:hypothetical protein
MDVGSIMVSVLVPIGFFGLCGYLVKAVVTSKMIKERSRLSEKALDKISSSKEMADFLKTKQGEVLLVGLSKNASTSKEKLLSSIFWGIVVFFSGIGIYIIKGVVHDEPQVAEAMGIVVIFIGMGMLLASVASLFFAKQWGLLNGDSKSSK